MSLLETCRHCGYSLPTRAATCAGCGRRHPLVRPEAPRRIPALSHHLRLAGPAKLARRLLVVSGWFAVAFGVAAAARFALTFEDLADEVSEQTPTDITNAARGLGWAALIALLAAGVVLGLWDRRARNNLEGLHLEPTWSGPWSLAGWAVPGRRAGLERRRVDLQWRDTSSAVAALPATSPRGRRWSRQPVSRVVARWWALWFAVPAVMSFVVVLLGETFEASASARERELVVVAGAAVLVIALRAAYDVVGIVTVAQAHRAEALLHHRDAEVATAGRARRVHEPLVVSDHEWADEASASHEDLHDVVFEGHGYDDDAEDRDGQDEAEEEVDDINDLSSYFVRGS